MPDTEYLADVKQANMDRLVSNMNGIGADIVAAYPMAEVQSWTIQRNEAEAIVAAAGNATLAMAPFLVAVCEAQYGAAPGQMRLAQVRSKAAEVKGNADRWAMLAAFVNGLRARYQASLEAATTVLDANRAMHDAFSELEAWRAETGI